MGSNSCTVLQKSLQDNDIKCIRVRPNSTTFVSKRNDFNVYFGGTKKRNLMGRSVNLNRHFASNKLEAFKKLKEHNINTVEWTDDQHIAKEWFDEGHTIVSRSLLTSHSGDGIVLQENSNNQTFNPNFPLHTKYVKKSYECRIHVYKGTVIDAQIKRRVQNAENIDSKIRNKYTGWVYCRDNFNVTPKCKEIAIAATEAVGLDFGAVDIIYNQHYDQFYILEVNTAPGLENTTLANYTKAIIHDYETNI